MEPHHKLPEIFDLLNSSLQKRKAYIEAQELEAYRLLQSGESHLLGRAEARLSHYCPDVTSGHPLAIDIYKTDAVIHVFENPESDFFPSLEGALQKLLLIKDFFYKNRTKQEIALPPQSHSQAHKEITISEYGARFITNLSDYLDTGLFLDHRETRRWIGEQSRGKIVLNTFAYTGSFSVYAAKGGAEKTHSVDLSKTYCEWIKKNLALNNLPPEKNWVYKMDTAEFFAYAARKKLTFDIIIIDPPTFSKNKGDSFSLQKDHPALIAAALKVLRPTGFILFSNNYHEFRMDEKKLPRCSITENYDLMPPDFAESFAHNCFIIRP